MANTFDLAAIIVGGSGTGAGGYEGLFHTGVDSALSTTLLSMYTGEGVETDLQIATNKVNVQTSLQLAGVAITSTATELNYLDGVTPGTAIASLALVVDANKDIDLDGGDLIATELTGTLQTAAQPNITEVGTISVGTWEADVIDHERGGLEADVNAYDGLIGITGGATYNQTGTTTQIVIFDGAGAPTSAALSGDVTMTNAGVVAIGADKVLDSMINWGTGATQVSAVDMPIADAGSYIVGTEVETALQEYGHFATEQNVTGFENNTDSTLSSDAGNPPTITLTPDSTTHYWIGSYHYTITSGSPPDIQIADTTGIHLIYLDSAGDLQELVNPSEANADEAILNKALVAWVYWETNTNTAIFLADERHGIEMSGQTHHWLHHNSGAIYHEGFVLSEYALNSAADADVAFELSDGAIFDEDLEISIVDGAAANQYEQQLSGADAEIPVMYRDDVDGAWIEQAASTLPYILQGGDTYVSYNNDDGDGSWSLIELANQKFMIMWMVATNDWQYPIKMICGSETYNTLALAVAGTGTEIINWGTLPSVEFVVLYQVLIQAAAGGTKALKIIQVNDYRTTRVTGASYSPTDHGNLSGLLDPDHPQYVQGDAGPSVYRVMSFKFEPGTVPETNIDCTDVNVASNEYNPATTTDAVDLAKSGTEGSWTLSADGKQLIVSPTETVVGTGITSIEIHNLNNSSTATSYYLAAGINAGGIQFGIRPWGTNSALDWTTILKAGDKIQFKCCFITST